MQPDSHGIIHGYYGTFNDTDKKPEHGVHYMIIDEYIKKSVDKEKVKFSEEMTEDLDGFKKSLLKKTNAYEGEIAAIHLHLSDVKAFLLNLMELNGLKSPPKVTKKEAKKKTSKNKEI